MMTGLGLTLGVIAAETSADFNRAEAMMFYRNSFLRYDLAMLASNVETIDRGDGLRLVRADLFYSVLPWIGDRQYEKSRIYQLYAYLDWQISYMLHMSILIAILSQTSTVVALYYLLRSRRHSRF